jgi:hypothetical protein
MNKRPLSITVVGWVFVCVGIVSVAAGTWRFMLNRPHENGFGNSHQNSVDLGLVWVSALVAIVGGAFLLRGRNWARWLLVVWMGLHIILSMLHSAFELVVHSVLFGVVLCFLVRASASEYFRGTSQR